VHYFEVGAGDLKHEIMAAGGSNTKDSCVIGESLI